MRRSALLWLVLAAAVLLAAPADSATRRKSRPTPVTKPTPVQVIPDGDTTAWKRGRLTLVEPIRPDTGLTTIAPYPPPHDTASDAAARGRVLNVPKPGTTTLVPLPPDGPSPEPILRVPPVYPPQARAKGIQGTVMVMARVLDDGSVAESHAITPIPYLDVAAEWCVRKWRFPPAPRRAPARPGVEPIQVWVTVPVKFTLH